MPLSFICAQFNVSKYKDVRTIFGFWYHSHFGESTTTTALLLLILGSVPGLCAARRRAVSYDVAGQRIARHSSDMQQWKYYSALQQPSKTNRTWWNSRSILQGKQSVVYSQGWGSTTHTALCNDRSRDEKGQECWEVRLVIMYQPLHGNHARVYSAPTWSKKMDQMQHTISTIGKPSQNQYELQ